MKLGLLMRCRPGRGVQVGLAVLAIALTGCDRPAAPTASLSSSVAVTSAPTAAPVTKMDQSSSTPTELASDPAQIGADLIADEWAIRDPATPEPTLVNAARRQQAAYRAIGRNPDWDAVIRPLVPPSLLTTYDRNIDARRQLTAMSQVRDTLPAWRIIPTAPADELMRLYREAEAATGVGWNYLAAINLIETRFGSIAGLSTAGAQGPMQFMPETWAQYGQGGDVNSPRDAIMGAGRYLAASGFANSPDRAIYAYNHANEYVRAVKDYAAILADDPGSFAGYYNWQVYYNTTAGDVLLPVGYDQPQRIPVEEYLASHPR
jgi:soluble lytic murein transglycosylase-like protein